MTLNDVPQPDTDSWYAASARGERRYPALRGTAQSDVCIIGGGYTGLSAAIHLRERGYSVTLLEAAHIASGASGRNGGHVGTGQRRDQAALERLLGLERARQLWQLGLEAVTTVSDLVQRFGIDCELGSGNLQLAANRADAKALQQQADHLQTRYGHAQCRYVPEAELAHMSSAQGYCGALLDEDARHLHPLNFALGLAGAADALGAALHEQSRALDYVEGSRGVRVRTAAGEVRARYLLLACNGHLGDLEPRIAGRIMPINNYMVATEPLGEVLAEQLIRKARCLSDTRFVVNYWKRSADHRLLFGGGETYTRRAPRDIRALVRPNLLRVYPELADTQLEYAWGGTLAITRNRLPDIGQLDGPVFYAQGFSGHGVSIGTLAGKLMAEAVSGSAERFDLMAGLPSPAFPGGTLLRFPLLLAGMLFYTLRDRLAR